MSFDGVAFGREIVAQVKTYLERGLEPVLKRLENVEKNIPWWIHDAVKDRALAADVEAKFAALPVPKDGRDGVDGKDVDPDFVRGLVEIEVQGVLTSWERPQNGIDGKDGAPGLDGRDGAPGLDGKDGVGIDGKDGVDGQVDLDLMAHHVQLEVKRVLDDWEKPQNGLDGKDGAPGPVGEKGLDGKDADPEWTAIQVQLEVKRVLDGWEKPQNGIDGKDGAPGLDGKDGSAGLDGKDGSPGLDGKDGAPGLDGRDGVGLDGKDGAPGLDGKDGAPGADGRDGIDGKDVDPEFVVTLVKTEAERILDGWERPQNGIDGKDGAPGLDGKDGAPGLDGKDGGWGVDGKDGAPGIDGKDGVDGKDGDDGQSVDMDLVATMVKTEVERILAGWEKPRDGVDGKDGRDGVDGTKGDVGAPGLNGVGVTSAFQDKSGDLILTMNDGTIVNVGRVQGSAGINGKDGAPGRDGVDGFDFEDMSEELDTDGRTLIRRYSRGDKVKEIRHTFAVVLDRGVWEEGRTYVKGDAVTFQGQVYIAQAETSAAPHTTAAKDDWRLAVKSGRNGKDGVVRTINTKPIVKVG